MFVLRSLAATASLGLLASSLSAATLLSDDFSDSSLGAWTFNGSSDSWSDTGSRLQVISNNTHGFLWYNDAAAAAWSNYQISFDFLPGDDDVFAPLFYVSYDDIADTFTCYRLALSYDYESGVTLQKLVGKASTTDVKGFSNLATNSSFDGTTHVYEKNGSYQIDISVNTDAGTTTISASITDTVSNSTSQLFTNVVDDTNALTGGSVGFYTRYMSNTQADNYLVTDAGPALLDVSAIAVSHEAVQLHWTDLGGSETGYNIYQKDAQGDWQLLGSVGADDESYPVSGLSASTTYEFKVDAVTP